MKRLFVLCTLLVAGCAGQVPDTQRYLLRSDWAVAGEDSEAPGHLAIGKLSVARYIDGHGLVVESPPGVVRAARYHEWAEPLRESLRPYLAREIERQSGAPVQLRAAGPRVTASDAVVIDLHVDQLHGAADGAAVLVAYWSLSTAGGGTETAQRRFAAREALSRDGYTALVDAEKRLLQRLATAVADSLQDVATAD